MPFHDDQELTPAERLARLLPTEDDEEIDLYLETCNRGFYINRDAAFNGEMALHRILSFLDKYSIPYEPPEISHKPNPEFWAMCFACVLTSHCGTEASQIRATIWMARSSQIGYNPKAGTYRVGRKSFTLHPLLSRKRQ